MIIGRRRIDRYRRYLQVESQKQSIPEEIKDDFIVCSCGIRVYGFERLKKSIERAQKVVDEIAEGTKNLPDTPTGPRHNSRRGVGINEPPAGPPPEIDMRQ